MKLAFMSIWTQQKRYIGEGELRVGGGLRAVFLTLKLNSRFFVFSFFFSSTLWMLKSWKMKIFSKSKGKVLNSIHFQYFHIFFTSLCSFSFAFQSNRKYIFLLTLLSFLPLGVLFLSPLIWSDVASFTRSSQKNSRIVNFMFRLLFDGWKKGEVEKK